MPIYEYACRACGHEFEELVSGPASAVACPGCTSDDVEKQLSRFTAKAAAPSGSRPVAAAATGGGCGHGGCGCRH